MARWARAAALTFRTVLMIGSGGHPAGAMASGCGFELGELGLSWVKNVAQLSWKPYIYWVVGD